MPPFLFSFTIFLPFLIHSAFSIPYHPPLEETAPALVPQALNITTLTADEKKESILECWSLAQLAVSNTPGIQGALVASLAAPNKLNFFDIPPKFDGGLHNAPVVQ